MSDSGNSYIMVVGDCWIEAFPIPNQEVSTVVEKAVDEVFLRYSVPEQLHCDQGSQFESRLMMEIYISSYKLLKVEPHLVTHKMMALLKGTC